MPGLSETGDDLATRRTVWPGSSRSLAATVVLAVADADGVPPEEVGPLHGVVDGDALDALFESANGTGFAGEVSFRLDGYRVSVYGGDQPVVRVVPARSE